jgi:hypothetical protein
MKEIEGKILNININDLIKKLKLRKARRVHKMMLYRRYVFQLMNGMVGYIRTREENKIVTITMKTYPKDSKYALESEIIVNQTLEESRDFLLAQGYKLKAYHETLREKWTLGGCAEIAIDSIPGIPTYVELECKNEKEIKKIADLLELDYPKMEYGAYDKQFLDYYGIDRDTINNKIPSLTFKKIDKELIKYVTKNKEMIKEVKKEHLKLLKKI